MIEKNNKQKKSNSNPFRSLFEVECFLQKINKFKDIICIYKKYKKLNK